VPAASVTAGQSWTLRSSMTVDEASSSLGSARLQVSSEDGAGLVWTVAGSGVRRSRD